MVQHLVNHFFPPIRIFHSLAVTNGHDYASGWRDNLAKEMSPDQVAEAERMAAELEPDLAECEAGPGAYSGS